MAKTTTKGDAVILDPYFIHTRKGGNKEKRPRPYPTLPYPTIEDIIKQQRYKEPAWHASTRRQPRYALSERRRGYNPGYPPLLAGPRDHRHRMHRRPGWPRPGHRSLDCLACFAGCPLGLIVTAAVDIRKPCQAHE